MNEFTIMTMNEINDYYDKNASVLEKQLNQHDIATIEKIATDIVTEFAKNFTNRGYAAMEERNAESQEETECFGYSAAEIAEKFNVLSQYCDIYFKDTCTIADIAEFLENVHLDANGNVWLMVQIDEYTFKRLRLNREAAGKITM